MDELFCIHCQRMTHVEEGIVFGHLVYIPVFDFDEPMGVDVDLCEFPAGFAYCPPPPEPSGDWQDALVEPGEDVIEPEVEVELNPALVGV